jgi:hypothetical protein
LISPLGPCYKINRQFRVSLLGTHYRKGVTDVFEISRDGGI